MRLRSRSLRSGIFLSVVIPYVDAAARFRLPDGGPANENLAGLDYRLYPRRTQEEAAVIEWGHSAIISALDASVAHFGPQTTQAALLEVETQPVLASPVNGVRESDEEDGSDKEVKEDRVEIKALDNADEIRGNFVVMTNTGGLKGVEMAKIAQLSGAAGLLVVNVDDERPDDIYRLPADDGHDSVDIPVVMISLNSANVLTTATVTPEMTRDEIVNNGMPERIRLYAGGDRPFFEDVEAMNPTIYLIHNLLTSDECDGLRKRAQSKMLPYDTPNFLEMSPNPSKFHADERVMLWQGLLQTPATKAVEERIEQVTGFPSSHYTDWIVDRLDTGSYWSPNFDAFPSIPLASILVFLTDDVAGGEVVYSETKHDNPVKITPTKGLAVVHHNSNDQHQIDYAAVRALMPVTDGTLYVATKFIFPEPSSHARRIALPLLAMPFRGQLPRVILSVHDYLAQLFGLENGGYYFDKLIVFLPVLVVLGLAQVVFNYVQKQWAASVAEHAKKKKA